MILSSNYKLTYILYASDFIYAEGGEPDPNAASRSLSSAGFPVVLLLIVCKFTIYS